MTRNVTEDVTATVDYDRRGDTGIWTVTDLNEALESGELAQAETHFEDHASDDAMDGCVVVIEETESLASETLSHINDQWTALAEQTGITRTAYVADGIARLAIANKNEAEGMEAKGFTDRETAIEWAAAVN